MPTPARLACEQHQASRRDNGLTPGVPRRRRRHAERRIFFEQRNQALDVGRFPRLHVTIEDGPQRILDRCHANRVAALAVIVLVERHARAVQGAVDGRHREIEYLSHFAGLPIQHVPQDQHGPLTRRQTLQGRDESQGHTLARRVPRFGPCDQIIGIRLKPDHFGKRRRDWRVRISRGLRGGRQDATWTLR